MRKVRFACRPEQKKTALTTWGANPVPCQFIDHAKQAVYDWLRKIVFHEYTERFVDEGYELCTIAHMTSADLVAIGINLPLHRRCLKRHIDSLIIWDDPFPTYVPDTVAEWLELLELSEYEDTFAECGFQSVWDVTRLCYDNLAQLGVEKLGHRKKLMLAIERARKMRKPVHEDKDPMEGADLQPFDYVTMQKTEQYLAMAERLKRPTGPKGFLRWSPGRNPPAGDKLYDAAAGPSAGPKVPPKPLPRAQPKQEESDDDPETQGRKEPLGEELAKEEPQPPQTLPEADAAYGLREVEQIVGTMITDLDELEIL